MNDRAPAAPDLVDPREGLYFVAVAGLSALIWAILVICGLGFPLVLCALFIWLANGILVARIKSAAIEVTSEQHPELRQALLDACSALGVEEIPRLYLHPFRTALDLFAVRHASRSFLVLSSSVLDSPPLQPAEIRFLLGQEIGCLRTHRPWKLLLDLPGRFLPVIGSAYSRAAYKSCDLCGAAAAHDAEASARAILFQSLVPSARGSIDSHAFAGQYSANRGFFVSWNELTSARPSPSYRVAARLAKSPLPAAPIHPLAYPAALFTVSGFGSGFYSFLFSVLAAAVLLGLVWPAHQVAQARVEARDAHIEHQERLLSAKEILLTEGTIDPRLTGIWAGGSPAESATADYLRWTTARKADGNLQTSYEQRANGVEKKWSKHGQWRIFRGQYQEIYDAEKPRAYQIVRVEQDSVMLTEDPKDANKNIVEVRQPGAP